ncbi:hypothetical protein [Thalassotalea litorea]|nr:hypothetical protein [Thalassotalea litorea]
MRNYLQKGLSVLKAAADKATDEIAAGLSLVQEKVNGLPVFVSAEKSANYGDQQFDEKHYFVVPFKPSEYQFALHTMRCLPNGVPEINNLPKRRVFHFPDEHAEVMLKTYMAQSAEAIVSARNANEPNSLEALADDIDALDKKLTYGMLLVGGLAAIFNPLIGAGIAAKALLPGIGTLLNKYGLRATGEKLNEYQLKQKIKEAQDNLDQEFSDANTLKIINPILAQLARAIRTDEGEYDPLLEADLINSQIKDLKGERWRELTQTAICHVYQEVYEKPSLHKQAGLGPEDIRWLKVLFDTNL